MNVVVFFFLQMLELFLSSKCTVQINASVLLRIREIYRTCLGFDVILEIPLNLSAETRPTLARNSPVLTALFGFVDHFRVGGVERERCQ